MTRKEYLIKLIKSRPDLPLKEIWKLLKNLNNYNDDKIEEFIQIFERSNNRKKRIENWEAEKVLEEENKIIEKNIKDKMKKMHEKEVKDRIYEEIELNRLIDEINRIW